MRQLSSNHSLCLLEYTCVLLQLHRYDFHFIDMDQLLCHMDNNFHVDSSFFFYKFECTAHVSTIGCSFFLQHSLKFCSESEINMPLLRFVCIVDLPELQWRRSCLRFKIQICENYQKLCLTPLTPD